MNMDTNDAIDGHTITTLGAELKRLGLTDRIQMRDGDEHALTMHVANPQCAASSCASW